jgi:hypothetical protein
MSHARGVQEHDADSSTSTRSPPPPPDDHVSVPHETPHVPSPYTHRQARLSPPTEPPLRAGQVLEIRFPTFTPRITIRSERELTVEVIAGDNVGFADTVEYQAVAVRDQLVVLSWREQIGSTIVHVLDFASGTAYTAITPATGGFMRLAGRIEVKS